jgi:LytS/YehU family sensor histidine kinase
MYSYFYGLPLFYFNNYLFNYLNNKYPWRLKAQKRFLLGIVYSVLMTMLIIVIVNALIIVVHNDDLTTLWDSRYIHAYYSVPLVITIIVSLFYHALGFYNEVRLGHIKEEKLKAENMKAKYEALKSQVNPHFLFNGLSALSGLIEEDPVLAQRFVDDFSGIYRYVLDKRHHDFASLKDELDFSRRYIALHKTRFEDSLSYEIDVPKEHMNKKIISLSLQILLENIFKHNRISQTEPMQITISSDAKYLSIKNKKYQRENIKSNKTGLENIKERYGHFTNDELFINDGLDEFTVRIPFIDIEV